MNTRRRFIKNSISLSTAVLMSGKPLGASQHSGLMMPEEGEPHERTWMAFVANRYIWSKRQIPEVKHNLILLAKTIAQYEPGSMLVSNNDFKEEIRVINHPQSHISLSDT
ncbi:MAG: agmatine deiminase family protein [Thiotrichales bacterium]